MKWSQSEFLNLLELRSQCWCRVTIGAQKGFSVGHSKCVFFYASLSGRVRVKALSFGSITLEEGQILFVLSGEAHTVRVQDESRVELLEFLARDEYVDSPIEFDMSREGKTARVLCGRLKVRWPGGEKPTGLPSHFTIPRRESLIDLLALEDELAGAGGSALMTRTAGLLFTFAFRRQESCKKIHDEVDTKNPIHKARQYIELHPFNHWTVNSLAEKVGMGRSNFASRFVAEVGQTPMDLITAERMKHADHLLQSTDIKLSAISEMVGYRSEAAFSRRFAAYFGVAPGKKRRQSRASADNPVD